MNKTIQFFAKIDVVISIVLIVPWLGAAMLPHVQYFLTNEHLVVDNYHQVLMQILGAMVFLWAMVRLKHTAIWQVQYDCIGRIGISALMLYYAAQGLVFLLLFVITELLGLYQWWKWRQVSA